MPSPAPPASPAADPIPVDLPRDDGPHDRLTEWWYYTGHLADDHGGRYGFEFVVFRAERGTFPVSWASHLAITDETGGRFLYAQRSQVGPGVDRSPVDATGEPVGFGLAVAGDTEASIAPGHPAWTMSRYEGVDAISAALTPGEWQAAGSAGPMAIELRAATDRDAVLHDTDGWIDFGPAGGSYYYSRPRLEAVGTITLDGTQRAVRGSAWFDHQWGDFIAVGGGGWDWFAVGLDDGTDLTISQVRDASGGYSLAYGTLVDESGRVTHLPAGSFTVATTAEWTSPRTGATYPAGWTIAVPGDDLEIQLVPTVADQELDTRLTTGVIYWEGSQVVRAMHRGSPTAGDAYVELTGYATGG